MKKLSFLLSLMLLCATTAFAQEQTKPQVLRLKMNDGATIVYPLADIKEMTVGEDESALTITLPTGEQLFYETIPTMLRVLPKASTNPTEFAFGTVTADKGSDLIAGDYALYISLSPTVVYTGEIDLATQTDAYIMKLYSYKEGKLEQVITNPVEGRLYTKLDPKSAAVTIQLEATFADGHNVRASWGAGIPVDANTLDDLVPGAGETSQMVMYNKDGSTLETRNITGISVTTNSKGRYEITFALEGSGTSPQLVIDPSVVNAGRIENLHTVTDKFIKIYYTKNDIDIRNYTNVAGDSEAEWSRHFTANSNAFVDVQYNAETDSWQVSFASSDYYEMYGEHGYGYRLEVSYK